MSQIHGQDFGGKWASKPGPAEGFNLAYSLTNVLGFQTGISFSTVYYDHRSAFSDIIYPYTNSDIAPGYYTQTTEKMDFTFLRVPLLLTISIPSAVQFNMKAGVFFSFMQDNSPVVNYYGSYKPPEPKKNDFGYLFSSGISVPLTANLKGEFNVSYLTGKKPFQENLKYRHGSSEFTLGIQYVFLKKHKTDNVGIASPGDSSKKVTVTYWGGTNVGWNGLKADHSKYSEISGPVVGFSINLPLGRGFSFRSGVSFERKGYSMKDSSTSHYEYIKSAYSSPYVDSKVLTDYLVIPLLLSFPLESSYSFLIHTGPFLGLKLNSRNVGAGISEARTSSTYTLTKSVFYDDFTNMINDKDVGWILGARVSLPIVNKFRLDLAVQYEYSFKDVYGNSFSGGQEDKFMIRNRSISFVAGFTIPARTIKSIPK